MSTSSVARCPSSEALCRKKSSRDRLERSCRVASLHGPNAQPLKNRAKTHEIVALRLLSEELEGEALKRALQMPI